MSEKVLGTKYIIYSFTISAFEIILAEMSGGGAEWRKDINLEPSSVWGKHF